MSPWEMMEKRVLTWKMMKKVMGDDEKFGDHGNRSAVTKLLPLKQQKQPRLMLPSKRHMLRLKGLKEGFLFESSTADYRAYEPLKSSHRISRNQKRVLYHPEMAPTFYVGSEAGLEKLDDYLLSRSYITGYQASKDDLTVHAAFTKPPSPQYVNVSRWFNHIEALLRIAGVSAEGSGVTVEGSVSFVEEAIATPPVAETKAAADEDDDSDVDLFGEETEEEKKAAEDRAAAVKASGKKKESGKL
ncbi:hypothetical protein L1987_47461 [Smallanthus sonchifolius]|uniref:Uncharacterized protein n=1 Tax=Smallanthus sonchifolius TaxID=185202 RepID=A0ACB9G2P8_9ASTR|nr:hypothetical protein L1987_47461 [Smallanthus sonchifolius]